MRQLEFGINSRSLIDVSNIDWIEKNEHSTFPNGLGCIFHMNSGEAVYVDESYDNILKVLLIYWQINPIAYKRAV